MKVVYPHLRALPVSEDSSSHDEDSEYEDMIEHIDFGRVSRIADQFGDPSAGPAVAPQDPVPDSFTGDVKAEFEFELDPPHPFETLGYGMPRFFFDAMISLQQEIGNAFLAIRVEVCDLLAITQNADAVLTLDWAFPDNFASDTVVVNRGTVAYYRRLRIVDQKLFCYNSVLFVGQRFLMFGRQGAVYATIELCRLSGRSDVQSQADFGTFQPAQKLQHLNSWFFPA